MSSPVHIDDMLEISAGSGLTVTVRVAGQPNCRIGYHSGTQHSAMYHAAAGYRGNHRGAAAPGAAFSKDPLVSCIAAQAYIARASDDARARSRRLLLPPSSPHRGSR